MPRPHAGNVTSLRQLAGELSTEITVLSDVTADLLAGHRGYQVTQQLPGIGPVPRWALIDAIQRIPRHSAIGAAKAAIHARRGS